MRNLWLYNMVAKHDVLPQDYSTVTPPPNTPKILINFQSVTVWSSGAALGFHGAVHQHPILSFHLRDWCYIRLGLLQNQKRGLQIVPALVPRLAVGFFRCALECSAFFHVQSVRGQSCSNWGCYQAHIYHRGWAGGPWNGPQPRRTGEEVF